MSLKHELTLMACVSLAMAASTTGVALGKSPAKDLAKERPPTAFSKPYAQGLVDRMAYLHTELQRIDMIATPPGGGGMQTIASTEASAIGRPANAARLSAAQSPHCTAISGTQVYECSLPLLDVAGTRIGALSMRLSYYEGQDAGKLLDKVTRLRDEFAETTPNLETLYDEMSIAPKPGDTKAQCMILDALRHRPDLMVLAMHVTPPGEAVNKMLSINERKFWGKVSEESEQQLAKNGNILLESFSKTHRLETHVPILAADGTQVGTMATVYFWHTQDEMPSLLQKTIEVQQELKPQIRDLASLYEPCQTAPAPEVTS